MTQDAGSGGGDQPKERSIGAKGDLENGAGLRELVVCSLEPWDEVWRRNQFFTDALLRRNPDLRVLFVEPPADPLYDVRHGRRPTFPRVRTVSADGRLRAFRPLKPFPRRVVPLVDGLIRSQVVLAARRLAFSRPTLWLNDVTYAPLIKRTGWPSLYDVTDDWLLAPFPPRELDRLKRFDELALVNADEVVVCSAALAASRGMRRQVSLIPNGADVDHFRRPRPRPHDLPTRPVAIYVGSLHDARLDVELVLDLARALPELSLTFVGPNSLTARSSSVLEAEPNVFLLGVKPYQDVPAYLQHADVVIMPHRVSQFTESLDPIKAYECLAVETPVVATPVAGFREHHDGIHIAERAEFATQVADVLSGDTEAPRKAPPVSWDTRVTAFEQLLRLHANE